MAEVLIPVVIDIEGAFEDAAKRVSTAMKPMQKAIDDNTAKIQLKIGTEWDDWKQMYVPVKKSLEDIIGLTERLNRRTGKTTYSLTANTQQLAVALEDAKNNYARLSVMEEKGLAIDYKKLDAYREAIQILMAEISQRERNVSMVEKATRMELSRVSAIDEGNHALIEESKTISQLTNKISALEGKLNNLTPETQEWRDTAREIMKATDELSKFKDRINELKTAPGSINRINAEMQKLNRRWDEMAKSQKFDKEGNLKKGAQKIINKYRELTNEAKKFGQSLSEASGVAAAKTKSLNNELAKTDTVFKRLITRTAYFFGLHTVVRFLKNIREVTAEFELQKVALGSIINDTEKAESLFRQIKAAAIRSPFEIKNLVSYTKQLSAYQIETEKLFDTTMKLADVSAGLGVDMGRLILAYGQVRAAAVLRGQELRQFTEAGIPLVDKLAEKFSELRGEMVSTGEVFQLISERAVPFRMIEEIFDDMTSAGGIFYKMQEKQAKTLAGQWANLKDAVSIMYDEIGNTSTVHGAMEDLISDARLLMKNWRTVYNLIKYVGGAYLSYTSIVRVTTMWTNHLKKANEAAVIGYTKKEKAIRRAITALIGDAAAKKVSTTATWLHKVATDHLAVSNNLLAKSFWKVTLALASNPFGALAIVVTGLITLFVSLKNRVFDVNKAIDDSESSIKELGRVRNNLTKLIDEYEELANKEKLSVSEAKKMRDISRELAQEFPKTAEGIDQQTGALSLNIEKLREYNELAEKAAVSGAQAQMRVNKKAIKDNQKEISRLTKENARGWGRNKTIGLLSPVLFPLTDKQMAENSAKINKLIDDNEKLATENKSLQDALDGVSNAAGKTSTEMSKWQEKLTEFNSRVMDGKAIQVISPDQIKNYSKLSDALEDIARKYNEYAEEEKKLESAIKDKNGEEKAELEGIKARTIARKNLAKEELDYYHAFYLTQKNSKRGGSYLQDLRNEINDITNAYKKFLDLSNYMSKSNALKEIGILFPQIGGWEPTYENMIGKLENMLSSYRGDADATRIIQQAISNIKFDDIKKQLENRLKKLEADLKRSETVRDFYSNILSMTGDESIATNVTMSVYGGVGEDFKERLQKEMIKAINEIDSSKLSESARLGFLGDITVFDIEGIKRNIDLLPKETKELFEKLLEQNEQYDAEYYNNFYKTYTKAMTYKERVDTIEKQRQQALAKAREKNLDTARVEAYFDKKAAEVELEAVKDTYTWTKAFEDLEGVSTLTLKRLISLIDEYVQKYGNDLEPQQLKELIRARENAESKMTERNAYEALYGAIWDTARAYKDMAFYEEKGFENTDEYAEASDRLAKGFKNISEASDQVNKDIESVFSVAKDLISVFSSDEDASYFNNILDDISKIGGGLGKAASGIAQLASGKITPQAIIQSVQGIAEVVSGFWDLITGSKIRKINKQIEYQQHLVEDLEYTYNRLEKAMEDSLGSDYIANYTRQLEQLAAKQKAYEEMARLEREKGKKADEEKIKEYEKTARDVADEIKGQQGELAEYLTDMDVTSAAKDFAKAWIDAYKEFGNTTDAMKEKFNEMVENMVVNSLAARLIQGILKPIFDEIDSASGDGRLAEEEIGRISGMIPGAIEQINAGMTGMINQLTAAGVNLRQQAGQFSGISRDIASASEESITGLAAGINTQNFYISHIDQNVALILSVLTGNTTTAQASVTGQVADPYKDQMLTYASYIPDMSTDLRNIYNLLNSVIRARNEITTKVVHTNI